jgi:hypothetical protein
MTGNHKCGLVLTHTPGLPLSDDWQSQTIYLTIRGGSIIQLSPCSQFCLRYATTATHESRFGQGSGDIFLSNVRCKGHEMSLAECVRTYDWGHSTRCQSYEAAGVMCVQMKGKGHAMGLAECVRTYNWGHSTQCQRYEAAGVVCVQMKGKGHAMGLAECVRTYNWGDSTQCQSYETAGVMCVQMKGKGHAMDLAECVRTYNWGDSTR